MKDKNLLFDRKSHVLYSKPCKKEIRAKIALHYPEAEREAIWEQVQWQYVDFLSDWRTDLGGKRNCIERSLGVLVAHSLESDVPFCAVDAAVVGKEEIGRAHV